MDLFFGVSVQNFVLGLHEGQDDVLLVIRRSGQLFAHLVSEPARVPEDAVASRLRLALFAETLLASLAALLDYLLGALDPVQVGGWQRVEIRETCPKASDRSRQDVQVSLDGKLRVLAGALDSQESVGLVSAHGWRPFVPSHSG